MMKISFTAFIILLLSISGCNVSNENNQEIDWTHGKFFILTDDSSVPDSIRGAYHQDAARLALREVYKRDSTKRYTIEIPKSLTQLFYDGLIRFYNAGFLSERNIVVEKYNIHTFPFPELYNLVLVIDKNEPWTSAWRIGNRFTGNNQIDRILHLYNLQLKNYRSNTSGDIVILSSPDPLNIFALAELFKPIQGITSAQPDGIVGDGNDIKVEIEDDYLKFTFILAFDDCPSGCLHKHYWVFHVYFDGKVQFFETFGDPI